MKVWNDVEGLDCCLSSDFGSGVKWVEGLVRGKTCNDGGGIPEGKVGNIVEEGLEACSDCGGLSAGLPPAAKTAGGIAWIRVSR